MSSERHTIHVVLIQSWTNDARLVEQALREANVDAAITCADFEAALHAELEHRHFDLAIFDPATPGMSREIVHRCLQESGRAIALVVLEDIRSLAVQVLGVLARRRN